MNGDVVQRTHKISISYVEKKKRETGKNWPRLCVQNIECGLLVFAIYEIWMPHVKLDNRRLVRATTWKWVSIKCSLNRIFIGKDADGKQNKKKRKKNSWWKHTLTRKYEKIEWKDAEDSIYTYYIHIHIRYMNTFRNIFFFFGYSLLPFSTNTLRMSCCCVEDEKEKKKFGFRNVV